MSLKLDNISQELSQHFKDLIYTVYTQSQKNVIVPYSHSSKVILIDGFAGSVLVNMQRITQEIPKNTPFCGSSLCQHLAEIMVIPENEQVQEAVAAYFKAQILPAMASREPRRLFDRVVINGKELQL